jgi:L-histidine N-alpha-methyltransferase
MSDVESPDAAEGDPNGSPVVAVEDAGELWDDPTELLRCLREAVPRIPPVYGYDERGSELFEAITRLPTYYLTSVEWRLLRRNAGEIAECMAVGALAELGSGSAKKTQTLLAACLAQRPTRYLPIDVSREMLESSAAALRAELPELAVTPLWGRYPAGLDWLRQHRGSLGGLVVSFLGSNLGNTTVEERAGLLAEIGATLRPGDGFLFSADLHKPAHVFERCYNDPPGQHAFAEFRLNHLTHLNRRFGADFAVHQFRPRAHYNEADRVVEGHVYALTAHVVTVAQLDVSLRLDRGDSVNVGFSAKFDEAGLAAELGRHGLAIHERWVDQDWRYGIFLARPVESPI